MGSIAVIEWFEGSGVVFWIGSRTIIGGDKPIAEQAPAAWTCCGRLSDRRLQDLHSSCHARITVNKTSPSSVNSLCLYPKTERRNVTLESSYPLFPSSIATMDGLGIHHFGGPRRQTAHSSARPGILELLYKCRLPVNSPRHP